MHGTPVQTRPVKGFQASHDRSRTERGSPVRRSLLQRDPAGPGWIGGGFAAALRQPWLAGGVVPAPPVRAAIRDLAGGFRVAGGRGAVRILATGGMAARHCAASAVRPGPHPGGGAGGRSAGRVRRHGYIVARAVRPVSLCGTGTGRAAGHGPVRALCPAWYEGRPDPAPVFRPGLLPTA